MWGGGGGGRAANLNRAMKSASMAVIMSGVCLHPSHGWLSSAMLHSLVVGTRDCIAAIYLTIGGHLGMISTLGTRAPRHSHLIC